MIRGGNYLKYEHYWKANFFCVNSSIFSLTANLLSVFTINLLALIRYCVVKSPLDSKFKEKNFLTQICLISSLSIIWISISSIVTFVLINEHKQLPTGLCSLLGHSHRSTISLIITGITAFCQTLSCFTIPIAYYFILKEMAKSKAAVRPASNSSKTGELTKSILVAVTNLLSWVPSSVLLIMTLLWDEYPYALLIWTTMIIMPFTTIIDPFIFVLFKWLRNLIENNEDKKSGLIGLILVYNIITYIKSKKQI